VSAIRTKATPRLLVGGVAPSISAMRPSAYFEHPTKPLNLHRTGQNLHRSLYLSSLFQQGCACKHAGLLAAPTARQPTRTYLVSAHAATTSSAHSLVILDVGSNIGLRQQPQHRLPVDTNCDEPHHPTRLRHWLATSGHRVPKLPNIC
jgi:hypothetical protein